ncbi:hypothetical protein, partial [Microbispora sp. KK1-11]|uniref:hypothetical protein n=1 Tax=Microbispora sp. KK1-11 TaxID=2053005 RepID=UPI001C8F009E
AIAFFSFDLDFAITKDHAMAVLISRRHASTSGNSYTTPVDATELRRNRHSAFDFLANFFGPQRPSSLTQKLERRAEDGRDLIGIGHGGIPAFRLSPPAG